MTTNGRSSRRRREHAPVPDTQRDWRQLVPKVALGCAGLFLLSTVYQVAFARPEVVAQAPSYRGDDDDSGLNTAETVGIAVGGTAVVAGALYYFGVIGGRDDDDDDDDNRRTTPTMPGSLSGIRLTPTDGEMAAGTAQVFDLQVRSATDGKWYSVTERSEATVTVEDGTEYVIRQDGTKNSFCVPLTAPSSHDGKRVTVVGTLNQPGQPPLTARASVLVRVPSGTQP